MTEMDTIELSTIIIHYCCCSSVVSYYLKESNMILYVVRILQYNYKKGRVTCFVSLCGPATNSCVLLCCKKKCNIQYQDDFQSKCTNEHIDRLIDLFMLIQRYDTAPGCIILFDRLMNY